MKITFLGGGNMATALIGGLLKQGFRAADVQVVELQQAARDRLSAQFGVTCHDAATPPALKCDVLLLAVKPQQMKQALAPIAPLLAHQTVVSIAAGTRTADLARWLGGYGRIVRCMPNTPALVSAGITGLFAASGVDAVGRQQAEQVLAAVGKTLWVNDEARMDAVTAISGSGPAYVFYFIEALQRAAIDLGLDAHQARVLALETFVGASVLAAGSADDVALLRERVTSKGGTTEAALKVLEARGVGGAIGEAVRAADARGRELGEQLGKD